MGHTSSITLQLKYPVTLPDTRRNTPLLNIALEDTKNLELQTNNCSWTSTGEVDPDGLLVGEEMKTKMTRGNTRSVDNSSAQRNKQNIPLPPPPPEEDSDSDPDMGHGLAHIPLYEGDEDPKRHWFVYK